jgi:hypothetical protein
LLFGCRAFEPEAIEVNRLPETYIVGSPAETSGAYFHFHVYWYGTDADGFVDRYVWALTDTSVQNIDTDDDEEDQRFNPATNGATLDIATYTTRTDTVFDFRISQGADLNYDMTLHVVAIDDKGAFDRTPARLHFFSNALGNPVVEFYRVVENAPDERFVDFDTLAYGSPLYLRWSGSTPNLAAYDPALLAIRDTVAPRTDGLLGFKWRLPGEDNCNPSVEDCFNPKVFDEASGDSVSVFGDVTQLSFRNDGTSADIFGRRLEAGVIPLLVNTLDVAGVQVPTVNQLLNIKVNYEPDTHILDGEQDPVAAHNDSITYPTYTVFHGPLAGTYGFTSGDTVPDRSYVTFKALGWDDGRDDIVSEFNEMKFQGRFLAGQRVFVDGVFFSFETTFSDDHSTEDWLAENPADPLNASSDTLGFQVGPFDYDVIMRAKDEHGTPDGTPDTLSFVGNYPPCVQCIELGRLDMEYDAAFDSIAEDNCYDGDCLDTETQLEVYVTQGDPNYDPSNPHHLGWRGATTPTGNIWVNASAGTISFVEPAGDGWKALLSRNYHMIIYLHGKDHPMEHWAPGRAHERIKAWRYQVDYLGDPGNGLADGGGRDNIRLLTGFDIDGGGNDPDPMVSDLFIVPDSGVWGIAVQVSVPFWLSISPETYWNVLIGPPPIGYGAPPRPSGGSEQELLAWQSEPTVQLAYSAWKLTTAQFSPGQVSAIAVDQSTCEFRFESNMYHYYDGTRVPEPNGRQCQAGAYDQDPDPGGDPTGILERGNLDLERFAAYSNDRVPATKDFQITVKYGNGAEFVGGGDPPGWIGGKSRRVSLR